MSERKQLGDGTLKLLIVDGMLAILGELSDGPVSVEEIETRAPGVLSRTARRRLQWLVDNGFVRITSEAEPLPREHGRPGPPSGCYALTDLGREFLLEVIAAAVHCEQSWRLPSEERLGAPGLWVLKLAADRHARAIARALADGPLSSEDLCVRLPQFAPSTLRRHLKRLSDGGVLVREQHVGEFRYELSDGARYLAIVPLRAAQCEWRRATPRDRALSGDLPGLLHVLAPLGSTSTAAHGTCRWHLDANATPEADMYLTAASGKIAALTAPPIAAPQAESHATPEAWCEALLHGDQSVIATTGDHLLFDAVFNALSTPLLA